MAPDVVFGGVDARDTGRTSKYVGAVFYRGPYSERPSPETDQSDGGSGAFGIVGGL